MPTLNLKLENQVQAPAYKLVMFFRRFWYHVAKAINSYVAKSLSKSKVFLQPAKNSTPQSILSLIATYQTINLNSSNQLLSPG
jgi:hypothetical protein